MAKYSNKVNRRSGTWSNTVNGLPIRESQLKQNQELFLQKHHNDELHTLPEYVRTYAVSIVLLVGMMVIYIFTGAK